MIYYFCVPNHATARRAHADTYGADHDHRPGSAAAALYSVIAIAEFPSVAEAERFYNSPEYTAAREFRIASTKGSALRASSVPPQE
jgi:uncharacterized protein (DUF1330 family)